MSKLYVSVVVVALLALAVMPALAVQGTFTVNANVPQVFEFAVTDSVINFGNLDTEPLTNDTYDELDWVTTEDILQWTLATNCDVAIVVEDAGNLTTAADYRCAGIKGEGWSTVPNNEIETQYKMDPAVSFYDNGALDDGYEHGGTWANQDVGWQQWLAQRWGSFNSGNATITGGFDLEMNMLAQIRPKGLGQQPGAYSDTFKVTVYNLQGLGPVPPPLNPEG